MVARFTTFTLFNQTNVVVGRRRTILYGEIVSNGLSRVSLHTHVCHNTKQRTIDLRFFSFSSFFIIIILPYAIKGNAGPYVDRIEQNMILSGLFVMYVLCDINGGADGDGGGCTTTTTPATQ